MKVGVWSSLQIRGKHSKLVGIRDTVDDLNVAGNLHTIVKIPQEASSVFRNTPARSNAISDTTTNINGTKGIFVKDGLKAAAAFPVPVGNGQAGATNSL